MTFPRPLVIGIAGGTGSGKTTVASQIIDAAGIENISILPQDAYYRAQPDAPFEVRQQTNYDEPSAFDTELMVAHVDALLRNGVVERPVYDFACYDRSCQTVPIAPRPVLLLEGILILHEPTLRQRMSLKVFVDAPPDERFIRRLERDVSERDRSAESVIAQYRRMVKPMHDLFVEPTKKYADLIVPGGGRNRLALEVLSTFVRTYLRDETGSESAA